MGVASEAGWLLCQKEGMKIHDCAWGKPISKTAEREDEQNAG